MCSHFNARFTTGRTMVNRGYIVFAFSGGMRRTEQGVGYIRRGWFFSRVMHAMSGRSRRFGGCRKNSVGVDSLGLQNKGVISDRGSALIAYCRGAHWVERDCIMQFAFGTFCMDSVQSARPES
jgi:hypothetical protein